jgi:hypothetical protein
MTQDFGEVVVDDSWLNQLEDVIFGHGISLLRWRSGGVKHPHDMPPFRFQTSPNFGDSSMARRAAVQDQWRSWIMLASVVIAALAAAASACSAYFAYLSSLHK